MMSQHPACDSGLADWMKKSIVALKGELATADYEAVWQRGSQWTLDHAVGLILEHLDT